MHVWDPLQRLQVEVRKLYERFRRSSLQSGARVSEVSQVLWADEARLVVCVIVLRGTTDLSTVSIPMADGFLWGFT